MRRLELTGQKFARLTVLGSAPDMFFGAARKPRTAWRCRCDCGKETVVVGTALKMGSSKSCGCLSREKAAARQLKHGLLRRSQPRQDLPTEYNIWNGMKQRCDNPKNQAYIHYGARGVKVCKRWIDDFEAFLADMGPRPSKKHSIERNNRDGDYEPANCRWATHTEQMRNTSRNRILVCRNQARPLSEWAALAGLHPDRLRARIYRHGWDVERAISTPILPIGRPRRAEA